MLHVCSYLYVINTSITKGRALFYNFTETKCICPPSSQMLKVYLKKNCKNVWLNAACSFKIHAVFHIPLEEDPWANPGHTGEVMSLWLAWPLRPPRIDERDSWGEEGLWISAQTAALMIQTWISSWKWMDGKASFSWHQMQKLTQKYYSMKLTLLQFYPLERAKAHIRKQEVLVRKSLSALFFLPLVSLLYVRLYCLVNAPKWILFIWT